MSPKFQVGRAAIALATAALTLGVAVPVAGAEDTPASVTLTDGGIALTAPSSIDFGSAVRLTGAPQTLDASLGSWTVTDARGEASPSGWSVDVSTDGVTNGDGSTADDPTLSMTVPANAPISGNAGATGPDVTSSNFALDPAGRTLLTAQPGQGVGAWQIESLDDAVHLAVPYSAKAGTYGGAITFTLSTQP